MTSKMRKIAADVEMEKNRKEKGAPHKVMDGDLSELAARNRYGNYLLLREDETLARCLIGRSVGPMANSSCMFGTVSHLNEILRPFDSLLILMVDSY